MLGLAPLKFVKDDLLLKISQIEELFNKEKEENHQKEEQYQTHNYEKIDTMMEYEIKNNKVENKNSGIWNLVRLRRALEFISCLLDEAKNPDVTLTTAAGNAYEKSLSPIHPWGVRKLVGIAVYALPYKRDFFVRLEVQEDQVENCVSGLLSSMQPLLASIYELYSDYHLHHLK